WDGIITLRRKTSSEENSVTFLLVQESGELLPFMSLYTITGETCEVRATRGNRFALARQVDTVYAAEFFEANAIVPNAMDETTLRESFSLLVSDWTNEDN
ncbi:MAG: VCBS repeat-containing protein, partial [Oscillospiraceae bacterium]|nr:VCBS repeat-containing protein [Oscillospiraceae bacterium]